MMNVTLLDNPDRSACGSRREAELTALVEKLLVEVAQLRGEVAELRQQAGYWKGMFEQTKRKNEKLQKEIDSLRAENRQLKDKLFAAKSEKKQSKDRSNRLDDPQGATLALVFDLSAAEGCRASPTRSRPSCTWRRLASLAQRTTDGVRVESLASKHQSRSALRFEVMASRHGQTIGPRIHPAPTR